MPVDRRFLEDYAPGDKLVSPARTLTESDIVQFAGLTGDWHPLHTDVGYAAESPFGERIAHGMLVLSIGSALIFRLGPHVYLPESFIAFYGMEQVRFVAPVKIGDTLHAECEVVSVHAKDDRRGLVTWNNRIVNQRGETCCAYVTKLLCGRRDGGAVAAG
jgi:3-hydroxybutyryl-CoA dehydratase